MFLIPVDVECHAGYKADEAPRAFTWNERRLEIEEVVDRWYEGGLDPARPSSNYFKVRIAGGREYILKQDSASAAWFLVESFRA